MSNSKLLRVLSFTVLLSLSGCASYDASLTKVPPPPCPDDKIAEELENIPYDGFEDFWSWLDRVYKFMDQTSIARGEKGCPK